jgi:hypothetical protein
MTEAEFFALPELSIFFPVDFGNGAVLREFTAKCTRCDGALAGPNVRGRVTPSFRRAVIVSAMGFCASCRLISSFHYRVYSDLSMTGRSPLTGRPSRWRRMHAGWKH